MSEANKTSPTVCSPWMMKKEQPSIISESAHLVPLFTTKMHGWMDEPDSDAMNIDHILDGMKPVNLSHEGGEFYEMIEQCLESMSKL